MLRTLVGEVLECTDDPGGVQVGERAQALGHHVPHTLLGALRVAEQVRQHLTHVKMGREARRRVCQKLQD